MLRKCAGRLVTAVVASSILSASALADLIEYSFPGQGGAQRTVQPSEGYINPTGQMTFALSAGVDRKIRVSIIKAGGQVQSTATSSLIGATDRITAGGLSYYGAFLQLPQPGEGSVKIRAEILASDGVTVLQNDEYPVVVDTTPPVIAGEIIRTNGGYNYPISVITNLAWGEDSAGTITASSLSDGSSGLGKTYFYAVDKAGVRREIVARLNLDTATASIMIPDVMATGFTPYDRAPYAMGFRQYDNAGNYTDKGREIAVDRDLPQSITIEVFDLSTNTWVPYSHGMTIYANPVQVRYGRRKIDHTAFNGTLYGWGDATYNQEDAEKIYYTFLLEYPKVETYFIFQNKAGLAAVLRQNIFNFTLAPGVEPGPTPTGIHYKIAGRDWIDSLTIRESKPFAVEAVKIFAEARGYNQTADINGVACSIPAGATECVVNPGINIQSGRLYVPYPFYVSKTDGTFRSHGGYLYTYWDFNAPTVTDIVLNQAARTVTAVVTDNDRMNNWQSDMWDTQAFHMTLEGNGQTVTNQPLSVVERDYKTKFVTFKLDGIMDGQFKIGVHAQDTYGNIGSAYYQNTPFIDSTPPVITIQAANTVDTLDQVTIHIGDNVDPSPSIKSISLRGGPASDAVELAWRSKGSGNYGLEYPILFPSTTEADGYTLEVVASDNFGNVSKKTVKFLYAPRAVAIVNHPDGVVKIPSVDKVFNRNNGTDIINSEQLTLDDGSVVSGIYDVLASLRADAAGAVVVSGKNVNPGGTVVLGKIDFTQTNGRISLPAMSGAPGATGNNYIVISTAAPNSPIISVNLLSWLPGVTIQANTLQPVQAMTIAKIEANVSATSVCRVTTSESIAKASDPILDPICLLEWDAIPYGLQQVAVDGSALPMTRLAGKYLKAGEQKASHSLYLFNKGAEKVLLMKNVVTLSVSKYAATFGHTMNGVTIIRAFDAVASTMQQLSGQSCTLTTNAAVAIAAGNSLGPLVCLIEFSKVPADLTQTDESPPAFKGVFTRAANHPLEWTASIFDTLGAKLILENGKSSFTVIEPPVTTSLSFSVNESAIANVTPTEDYPTTWEKKTYSILAHPEHGSVSPTDTGFTYKPTQGYLGTDTFKYRVTDVSGMFADGTATITVEHFNYPPTWTGVTIKTKEGQISDHYAPTVEDINLWDTHSFAIVTNPANGTVRVFVDRIEYTPNPGFYGEDSFTFSATDQGGLSVEGEGKVTVTQFNFAPTGITPSAVKMYAGIGGTADLEVIDPNNWGSHTLQVVKQPAHGHVTVDGMSITYKTDGQAETSVQVRAIDQDGLYVDRDIVLKMLPAWEMFKDRQVQPTSVAPSIPAVKHQMTTRLGAYALRIPDQEVIQALGGEIIAIVTPDSKVGVTLEHRELSQGAGMRLVPTKMTADLLEARLGGLDVGVDGQALVYLSRADMTGPVYSVPVTVWAPEGVLTADAWEILQASGRAQISFSPSNGACSILTSEAVAKPKNALQDRACYVTWTKTPDEWRNASTLANLMMDAGGSSLGNQTIEATAYVFDPSGVKHKVASFTRDLKILPVADQIRFGLKPAPAEAYQKVQQLSLLLRHTDGPVCDATANEGVAKKTAQQWSSRPSCLIRWMQMPEGMAQQRNTVTPLAEGTMTLLGANNISWKASMFTPSGQEIDIGYGEQTVNVIEPPAIEIDMPASNLVKEGLYSVSQLGGYVGSASVTAIAASLDVAINRADAVIERSTIPSYGRAQRFTRYIEGAEAPLWSVTPYSVDVGYTALPEMRSTKTASLLAVPHDKILPVILNDERTVLDTVSLPIRVAIKDTRYMEDAYRLSSMGDWDIRLLSTTAGVNYEPMTNWEPIDENGEAEFEIDLQSLTNKAVRIIAEARVRSPVPEYELIRQSGSPMVLSVLNGESLDGSIQALRVIGPAPLRSSFYAVTNDRYQSGDLGDVRWEMSKDGGVTWEAVEANAKLPQRLSMVFQRGTYLLRAELTNRNSGAKSMTPTVEVIAYVVPVARLKGPANVFIGDSGTFTLTDLKGNALDTTGMVVEWSEDRGKTWAAGEGSYRLSRNSADRVYLTARLKYSDSPEDKRVYKTLRAGVAFRPVRPPRVQIIGPRRPEVGKEATWVANLMMPYPKMDMTMDGEFILPDGTVVDSTEVKYTPTREDMEKEESYISVRSWINGYEDRGGLGLTQHRLIFWSYDWPEWKINTKYSAKYAPADLTMTARSLGLFREFEGLTIEWDIPPYAGLEMIKDSSQTSRIVRLTEPGIYTFGAHITDSRGNYSYAETEMEFLEPIPWDVKLSWSGDNDANRAPLGVLIRPSITGGHPKDQILSKTFSLNGETLSSSGDYGRATLEEEGVYTVKLDVASAMGHTATGQVDISVARNKPPVCKLELVVGRTSWLAKAVCTDEDGRMAKNLWFINGEQQALSSNSISVPMWRYPDGEPVITLVGIDNSGAESPPVSNK